MSTQGSERLRLSLSAIGAVASLYLLLILGLQGLARAAESSGEVYPYKSEDWLRYLVRGLWVGDDSPLLLLTGPSSAREDLLWEKFAEAWPDHRVVQGSLSLGTFADVLASLEYIERTYGPRAVPAQLVLGLSTRFVAELPAKRPFAQSLESYSPHFRLTREVPAGFTLTPKPRIAGAVDGLDFLWRKQQPRYQAGLAWLAAQTLGSRGARLIPAGLVQVPTGSATIQWAIPPRLADLGLRDYAMELVSPYKYHGWAPYPEELLAGWLDDPTSWWQDVYRWDARRDEVAIRARAATLLAFAARHSIDLYIVDLPEARVSRRRYLAGRTDAYHEVVRAAFHPLPVLDLRCLLPDDLFLDAEHALEPGARIITERVIGFMRDARRARALGAWEDPEIRHLVTTRWAGPPCERSPGVGP